MTKQKSFLKWCGSKLHLIDTINQQLPKAPVLHDICVGSGSVFLNTNYEKYVLNDINSDLINLFKILKKKPKRFVKDLAPFFTKEMNQEKVFYQTRERFNKSSDDYERALIFVYLNKTAWRGLCRYNLKGGYNVPFGFYTNRYYPYQELLIFAGKLKGVRLTNYSFEKAMLKIKPGQNAYIDPPYSELNSTSNFTQYTSKGFSDSDHVNMVRLAKLVSQKGGNVIISNHDTLRTRELYCDADIKIELMAQRNIGNSSTSKKKAPEIMVSYLAK